MKKSLFLALLVTLPGLTHAWWPWGNKSTPVVESPNIEQNIAPAGSAIDENEIVEEQESTEQEGAGDEGAGDEQLGADQNVGTEEVVGLVGEEDAKPAVEQPGWLKRNWKKLAAVGAGLGAAGLGYAAYKGGYIPPDILEKMGGAAKGAAYDIGGGVKDFFGGVGNKLAGAKNWAGNAVQGAKDWAEKKGIIDYTEVVAPQKIERHWLNPMNLVDAAKNIAGYGPKPQVVHHKGLVNKVGSGAIDAGATAINVGKDVIGGALNVGKGVLGAVPTIVAGAQLANMFGLLPQQKEQKDAEGTMPVREEVIMPNEEADKKQFIQEWKERKQRVSQLQKKRKY